MIRDFADFLAALNNEGVLYVVIGGIAVLSYVPYRTTRDLDVLIAPSLDNGQRAHRAVKAWGGFEPAFSPEDFVSGDVLSFGGLLRVEIHTHVPGVSWEEVWARRVESRFVGVATHFASLDDLIAMKQAAGHPEKDLPDLDRLRLFREGRR